MNVVPYFLKLKDKTFIKGYRDYECGGVSPRVILERMTLHAYCSVALVTYL